MPQSMDVTELTAASAGTDFPKQTNGASQHPTFEINWDNYDFKLFPMPSPLPGYADIIEIRPGIDKNGRSFARHGKLTQFLTEHDIVFGQPEGKKGPKSKAEAEAMAAETNDPHVIVSGPDNIAKLIAAGGPKHILSQLLPSQFMRLDNLAVHRAIVDTPER